MGLVIKGHDKKHVSQCLWLAHAKVNKGGLSVFSCIYLLYQYQIHASASGLQVAC